LGRGRPLFAFFKIAERLLSSLEKKRTLSLTFKSDVEAREATSNATIVPGKKTAKSKGKNA
jgi:hypothetical protein